MFQHFTKILREEVPGEIAETVIRRITAELAGAKIAIPPPPRLTDHDILEALRDCGWHIAEAAKRLELHPSALYRRLENQQRHLTRQAQRARQMLAR
ncbi:helix-turn-helix domain-containing protein [Thiobaca trueperi]|uniref:Regulatory Fis family protein n=1 Tax=Thiobaca trueperi TaxID=127458 RepID=A0A4V2V1A1_9GAMM|nr:helix-turn-helix domain-containing protein [Thiobaca trueperi]TCT20272.1 regulatory Fis family protein [Thiobaca trueperi]